MTNPTRVETGKSEKCPRCGSKKKDNRKPVYPGNDIDIWPLCSDPWHSEASPQPACKNCGRKLSARQVRCEYCDTYVSTQSQEGVSQQGSGTVPQRGAVIRKSTKCCDGSCVCHQGAISGGESCIELGIQCIPEPYPGRDKEKRSPRRQGK